jgi:hypothetical protein
MTRWHRQAAAGEDSCMGRRSQAGVAAAAAVAGTWRMEGGRDGDGGWKEGKAGRDVT